MDETSEIHCPHDRAFKSLMADSRVAKDFFKKYLPEQVLSRVDLNNLTIESTSFIDENLNATYADVLFKTTITNNLGYLYLLCEHKSTPDKLMPFKVWQYKIRIWADHLKKTGSKTLPLVIPIIFYHGKAPYTESLDIRDIIDAPKELIEEFLFKKIHLIDTHNITNEDLREDCWSDIMTFVFKNIFVRDFTKHIDQLLAMFTNLSKVNPVDERMRIFLETLIKYLWDVSEMSRPETLIERAQVELPSSLRESVMTPAKYFAQQAVQEVLLQLIQNKFGSEITSSDISKVKEANHVQVKSWINRILIASSLNELFEDNVDQRSPTKLCEPIPAVN